MADDGSAQAGGKGAGTTGVISNGWTFATVLAVLAAIVVIVGLVLRSNKLQNATDVATVLGILVPGLVTIGAAVYGVTVQNAASAKAADADAKVAGAAKATQAVQTSQAMLSPLGEQLVHATATVQDPNADSAEAVPVVENARRQIDQVLQILSDAEPSSASS